MFTPAEIAQEVEAIAAIFEAAIPQLQAVGIEPTVIKAMTDAVNDLEIAAQAFAAADAESMPSVLLRIENDVDSVLAAMAAQKSLPPTVKTSTSIVRILMPTIAAIVGIMLM